MDSETAIVQADDIQDSIPESTPEPGNRSSIVPPYALHSNRKSFRSTRSLSSAGSAFQIRLEDHVESPTDSSAYLWARSVTVYDWTIVGGVGQLGSIGAYVVWNCRVETLRGSNVEIRKRYSEFVTLRERLAATFPRSAKSMPQLPPKSVISKFRAKFLEQRRQGLQYFLNCILLNPEFSSAPILKEFLFE